MLMMMLIDTEVKIEDMIIRCETGTVEKKVLGSSLQKGKTTLKKEQAIIVQAPHALTYFKRVWV